MWRQTVAQKRFDGLKLDGADWGIISRSQDGGLIQLLCGKEPLDQEVHSEPEK
jgi:hypothetical protein